MTLKPDVTLWCGDHSSRGGADIDCFVVHTAEGATSARALGLYFQGTSRDVSSHDGIGQDGQLGRYVPENRAAWTAGKVNHRAYQVELCGFAKWDRETWLRYPAMLDTLARLMADVCPRHGIKIKRGTIRGLQNRDPAVYDHDDVSKALGGTHWDVGNNFPWDIVIPAALKYAGQTGTETPTPKENDMATPLVFLYAGGRPITVALGVDSNGAVQARYLQEDGDPTRANPWGKIKLPTASGGLAATTKDGRGLTVVGREGNRLWMAEHPDLYDRTKRWAVTQLGRPDVPPEGAPALTVTRDGEVLVSILAKDGRVYVRPRTGGTWADWTSIGKVAA